MKKPHSRIQNIFAFSSLNQNFALSLQRKWFLMSRVGLQIRFKLRKRQCGLDREQGENP